MKWMIPAAMMCGLAMGAQGQTPRSQSISAQIRVQTIGFTVHASRNATVRLAIHNPTDAWLYEIGIECDLLDKNGDTLGSRRDTVKGEIKPKQSVTDEVALSRTLPETTNFSCYVRSLERWSPI